MRPNVLLRPISVRIADLHMTKIGSPSVIVVVYVPACVPFTADSAKFERLAIALRLGEVPSR